MAPPMTDGPFQALLFPDAAALSRGVGACPDKDRLAAACVVLRAREGEGDEAEERWLLAGEVVGEEGLRGGRRVEAQITGETIEVGKRRLTLLHRREEASPLMGVPSLPWGREPEPAGVAALCPTPEAYRAAISAALELGQESMRAAALAGGEVVLLLDEPSWFLLQTWHETGAARVYWRGDYPNIYLPWGQTHPLARRVRGFEAPDALFFAGPEGWRRLPLEAVQDVYTGISLNLPQLVEASFETRAELPRVQVPLRWGFRPRPVDPTLWILPDPPDVQVEALLAELSEGDLRSLQLAVVERGEEARFLIRRLAGAASEAAPPVPGQALAPYAGFGNLLLPVDRRLDPPVRKDRFREMLGLIPGEMVLLLPDGEGEEGREGMRALRVPERAFGPLEGVVEYQVRRHQDELEAFVASAVLDFSHLEYAPERGADQVGGRRPRGDGKRPPREGGGVEVPGDEPASDPPTEAEAQPAARKKVARKAPTPRAPTPRPESDAGPDPEEQLLETAALETRAADDWRALAAFKAKASRWPDVLYAHEEVLWDEDEAGEDERGGYLDALAAALGIEDKGPEARYARALELSTAGEDPQGLAARLLAFSAARPDDPTSQRGAIEDAYKALEPTRLRRKARWLAWREVLGLSGDETQQERQREEILGSLSRRGLDPEDRPSFLGRFLRARVGGEQWGEQADLAVLLDHLQAAAMSIPAGPFRLEAQALVLRTRLEAERGGNERPLIEELNQLIARVSDPDPVSLANQAGALSQLAAEDAAEVFREVFRLLRSKEEGDIQTRVFENLFSNLVFADRFSGAQSVVRGALELLRELSPTRRCQVLADVAPRLVELGLRVEGVELCDQLLARKEIQDDLYYVERTVAALRVVQDPEPIPREAWEVVGASIEASAERFDPLYLELVEEAVVALGEPFVDRLNAKVLEDRDAGSYAGLILGACRLRLLADAGQARAGLDQVERALPACWGLPEVPSRARALCRYIRAVAHFGNPDRGEELLSRVVRETHASGPADLDAFYRAEVLGEVARTAGRLGQPERAVRLLEEILEGVEARIGQGQDDAALLFEVLSIGIEVLLELGEWAEGAPLVERVEQVLRERVEAQKGVHRGPWFYLHRGRVVCARALLYMGLEQAGTAALTGAVAGFRRVSALDRPDLLKEAARVLPFVDGQARRTVLADMVELMKQMEDYGEYDRRCRAEVVAALAHAVRPGADAYRREQSRWDALEARRIRRRVAREHPASRG